LTVPTPPQGQGIGDDDGDELVQVAYGNDPVEAPMIQGLLESGGIPSLVGPPGLDPQLQGIGLLRCPASTAARDG
jgi:hypothetical protein